MPGKLEQWRIDALARAQEGDIRRRKEFLTYNRGTQQAIYNTFKTIADLFENHTEQEVLGLYIDFINDHKEKDDSYIIISENETLKATDWYEVDGYIRGMCFCDSDMDGMKIVRKRVEQEMILTDSLMRLCAPEELFN